MKLTLAVLPNERVLEVSKAIERRQRQVRHVAKLLEAKGVTEGAARRYATLLIEELEDA